MKRHIVYQTGPDSIGTLTVKTTDKQKRETFPITVKRDSETVLQLSVTQAQALVNALDVAIADKIENQWHHNYYGKVTEVYDD